MDEGLAQILFFLAVIVFSIIDAVARKRKKEREMGGIDPSGEGEDETEEDIRFGREKAAPSPWESEAEFEMEEAEVEAAAAEGMIPADLWEEITGMKRPPSPDVPRAPVPEHEYTAPTPAPMPWGGGQPTQSDRERDWRETTQARSSEARSSEARSSQARPDAFPDRLRPTELAIEAERIRKMGRSALPEVEVAPVIHRGFPEARTGKRRGRGGALAGELRKTLRGDAKALQKAVLYREILGRPIGSREGPGGWEEPAS